HAGRRGLAAGVVVAALERMASRGSAPERVRAAVGPAVCGRCYEVPEDLRHEVDDVVPGTASTTSWGTPALDLRAGVRSQLRAAGVTAVVDLGACTLEDPRFFSHRATSATGSGRTRPAGRFAGVVRVVG
ncbi:polyphenol oxidase family protein, partial [Actinotalea ferrariae]|uniref:polyphenol oxidase family protein n=1 Tax=Actinotalea ferrariae TaxID=1386098 RepID=UPI001C8C237F